MLDTKTPYQILFNGSSPQTITGKYTATHGLRVGAALLSLTAGSVLTLSPGATLAYTDEPHKVFKVDAGATLTLRSDLAATASLGELPDSSYFQGRLTLERQTRPTDTLAHLGTNTGWIDWHQVSIPFVDAKLNAFGNYNLFRVHPNNECNIFRCTEYDVTKRAVNGDTIEHDGWKVAARTTADTIANPGGVPRGLRYGLRKGFFGSGMLKASGQPFTHEQEQRVTFTPGMWQGGGWNLMSNPYPAEIDWDDIWQDSDSTKVDGLMSIWNPDSLAYGFYNARLQFSDLGVTDKIASMQSFFVYAKPSAGLLSQTPNFLEINERHKVAAPEFSTASFLREAPVQTQARSNFMHIRMSSNPFQGSSGCYLQFQPGAMIEFDSNEDSPTLGGNANFHTLTADDVPCSINTYPSWSSRYEVRCRFKAPTNTTYTVRIDSLESFPAGSRFFLRDRGVLTGRDSIQDLLINNVYSFRYTGPANLTIDDRFSIIGYAQNVSVKDQLPGLGEAVLPLEAFLFPNPAKDVLTVKIGNGRGNAAYRIVSVTGQLALQGKAEGSNFSLDVKSLAKGIYLLRVEENGRSVTRRFVKE